MAWTTFLSILYLSSTTQWSGVDALHGAHVGGSLPNFLRSTSPRRHKSRSKEVGGLVTCAGSDMPKGRRVVSVTDLHGDWIHAIEELTRLGFLGRGKWAAGNATLVVTGDVVDRGYDGMALWKLLFRLQDEALLHGGSVILLLGNHEVDNLLSIFTDVSEEEYAIYGGQAIRKKTWASNGSLGRELRARTKIAALVEDVLYVHAGLLPSILDIVAHGLSGEAAVEAMNSRAATLLAHNSSSEIKAHEKREFAMKELFGGNGPLWTRELAMGQKEEECPKLAQTLEIVGARRMVVGHTEQRKGKVKSRCNGRLIVADTFMSEAMTGSASKSERNEAAMEFYGDSSTASAVYLGRRRAKGKCVKLPLSELSEISRAPKLKPTKQKRLRGSQALLPGSEAQEAPINNEVAGKLMDLVANIASRRNAAGTEEGDAAKLAQTPDWSKELSTLLGATQQEDAVLSDNTLLLQHTCRW